MSQQKIIRNVTTMDRRPVVRVTTEDVLQAVRERQGSFTTCDIARGLGVEEYPVRAAIFWLVKRSMVEKCGSRKLLARAGHMKYCATLYQMTPRAVPVTVDFAALNRVFGIG